MALKYEDVLKKMGWVDGFRVPIANKENQALEVELEQLMLRKAKAIVAYDNAEARHRNLEKHLKYVLQESEQNQVLLGTYNQRILQERDLLKCKKHETENVEHDIRRIGKEKEVVLDRMQQKRDDLAKNLIKLEKLKANTAWDLDASNAWEEALKRKDDDNELLKRFSSEDAKRANDLEARRCNLQVEVTKRRELVQKMAGEMSSYETTLDRTSKTLKKMHEERRATIVQWETAVNMLRQRNHDIERCHQDLLAGQEVLERQQEMLDDQNAFLAREILNNKEMHFVIEDLNQRNSRMRRERNENAGLILELKNELSTVKCNLIATANALDCKRKELKNVNNEIVAKSELVQKRQREVDTLRSKLDETVRSTMTSDQRAKQLERMIEEAERNRNSVLNDHNRLQIVLYKNQQTLYELQSVGKLKETSIQNFATTSIASKRELSRCYVELEQRKEIIYNIEYRINEMENRLTQLEGTNKNEDIEILEERIETLNEVLNKHNEVKVLLQKEIRRLDDEMRRLTSAIASDNENIDIVKGKLQDQVLLFEGGLKQAEAAKHRSQQKQVEENVLKLKIDHFENAIKSQNSKLYNLQRFRLDLDCAMKEKQVEIEGKLETLKIKKRNLEEEIHRLKCDVVSRDVRIEQYQKKHHLALMSFDKDADGNPLSMTQIKIRNAQEKYELVTEGDELDNKIKKTESEIVAMENALKIVNATNSSYRKSLAPIGESDDEVAQMKEVEDLTYGMRESIRSNRKSISTLQSQMNEIQESIAELRKQIDSFARQNWSLKEAYDKHRNEEEERNNKIVRADKQIKQTAKRLPIDVLTKYNKDFMLQQLENANRECLHKLADLMTKNAEHEAIIAKLFREHDMDLPRVRSLSSIYRTSDDSSTVRSLSGSCTSSSSEHDIPRIDLKFEECNVERKSCMKKSK